MIWWGRCSTEGFAELLAGKTLLRDFRASPWGLALFVFVVFRLWERDRVTGSGVSIRNLEVRELQGRINVPTTSKSSHRSLLMELRR